MDMIVPLRRSNTIARVIWFSHQAKIQSQMYGFRWMVNALEHSMDTSVLYGALMLIGHQPKWSRAPVTKRLGEYKHIHLPHQINRLNRSSSESKRFIYSDLDYGIARLERNWQQLHAVHPFVQRTSVIRAHRPPTVRTVQTDKFPIWWWLMCAASIHQRQRLIQSCVFHSHNRK